MAYTTVNKATDFFNNHRYMGNGQNAHAVTGVGFQADLSILKKIEDGGSGDYEVYDALRGATKRIYTNVNSAEGTLASGLQSFNSDGFTLGTNNAINGNGDAMTSLNWKANGVGSSNSTGTITSQYTSANTTAGFSVVTFTGTGATATVGHGLGKKPAMIWAKVRNGTDDWNVWLGNKTSNQIGLLNEASGFYTPGDATIDGSTTTTDVVGLGSGSPANRSGSPIVLYCWAELPGYSKFNTYRGNGSATNGAFIYTGFAPKMVVCKTTGTDSWMLYTDKISGATAPTGGALSGIFNRHNLLLEFNNTGDTQSAGTNQGMDMLSNGFKLFEDNGNLNGSGQEYIYMAWGQSIVGTNNIPVTAR